MFEEAFGPSGPQSEAALRAELEALARERVDVVEARLDFWRWDGLLFIPLLFRLGKAWIVWLSVLILVAAVASAAVGWWPVTIACLGLTIAVEVYEYSRFEEWVAAHNARLDARIKILLGAAGDETP